MTVIRKTRPWRPRPYAAPARRLERRTAGAVRGLRSARSEAPSWSIRDHLAAPARCVVQRLARGAVFSWHLAGVAAIAAALAAPAAPRSARAQAVPLSNPGFEADLSGWTYWTKKKADAIRVVTTAHTGSKAVELRDKDAYILQVTSHAIAAGDEIVVRFFVRAPAGGKEKDEYDEAFWRAALVWVDGKGKVQFIAETQAFSAATWTERMLAFTVPAGDPSIGRALGVYFGSGKKDVLLDDVVLEVNAVDCAGTGAPLSGTLKPKEKRVYAQAVDVAGSGTLQSLAVYVAPKKEKDELRLALYADAGGSPGALLAETAVDRAGSKSWHWHTIPAPAIPIAPGRYWIAVTVKKKDDRISATSSGTVCVYDGDAVKKGFASTWPGTKTEVATISVRMCWVPGDAPDLVGWWKLDETGGWVAADSSGRDHPGTLHNADPATAWQNGRCGRGLAFDGIDDEVVVPDHDDFDGTVQLTVAFWCRPTVLDGNPRGPISKRIDWTQENSWGIFFWTGNRLYVDIEGNDDRFSTNATFSENTWVHIAVVFDGTRPAGERVRVYVDGVLDTVAPESSASISNTNSPVVLGHLNGNSSGFFAGVLDEVRIYRRALTVTEIADVMNCASGAPRVVRWREVTR